MNWAWTALLIAQVSLSVLPPSWLGGDAAVGHLRQHCQWAKLNLMSVQLDINKARLDRELAELRAMIGEGKRRLDDATGAVVGAAMATTQRQTGDRRLNDRMR